MLVKKYSLYDLFFLFSGKLIDGDGVLTALLKRNGIKVISEDDLQ